MYKTWYFRLLKKEILKKLSEKIYSGENKPHIGTAVSVLARNKGENLVLENMEILNKQGMKKNVYNIVGLVIPCFFRKKTLGKETDQVIL